jgi:hypothetical protein
MALFRALLLAVLLLTAGFAEVRMSVQQLRSFIESSSKLGHSDRQVAGYLKDVSLTQRLEPGVVEDLTGVAGPRTLEALRNLVEASKSKPAPPPPPAPKPPPPPIPAPSSEEQGRVLDQAREYALEYSKKLPNFICTQVTRRYEDPSGLEFWGQQDVVTSKLSYFEQKEDYKVILVNNHYVNTTMDRIGGSTVKGEFGSMLRMLFDQKTQAHFEWARWATLRGRRMHVFAYDVALPRSDWHVGYEKQHVRVGYKGHVYVDRDTMAVMRLTFEASDMPVTFPMQEARLTLDYDYVTISGSQFILPLKSTMRLRRGKHLFKNDTEYRMYNRFGAEATITFTPDELPDEQPVEEPAEPPKP